MYSMKLQLFRVPAVARICDGAARAVTTIKRSLASFDKYGLRPNNNRHSRGRERLLISLISCLVLQYGLSAQQIDSTLPPVHWIRVRTIDIKHIALDLRFDWTKKQATGTAAITFAPLHTTDKITLDAVMLTIHSISIQGKALKFNYDGGDKDDGLAIQLDRSYSANEDLTLTIDYHTNWVNAVDPNNLSGSNGKGLRFSQPTYNDPLKPKEIWSMGDPESNRYWFPSYDAPNDWRTTEFRATVDKPLTVIANGNLLAVKENADGTHTFHYKTDRAHSNHLTSFAVGEYVDIPQRYEDIELHNYSYPKETEATAVSVKRLPDMMKFFSEKIGEKYPFSRYSQVFVQDIPWGMGGNMLATQSENMVDDASTHADYLYLWDALEGETLAHQWFGNYLGCRDWSHVWLNRGFAHYFDELYHDYKIGHEDFLLWRSASDQSTYFFDWNAGYRHPIVTKHYDNALSFTSDNYSIGRGAMVLRMLHKHLGDEKWWNVMRHYVQSNAGKSVTTEDFRRAIEETTGEPMDWFFDQWVYKMGHPVFEVSKIYDESKKQLTLTVRQTQKPDLKNEYPQTEYFQGKVSVEIDGMIETIWLESKVENVFTFPLLQAPKLVNFDYESVWISEIKFDKITEERLYQAEFDRDVLAQRKAMTELVVAANEGKLTAETKEKLKGILRKIILSNAYWRIRTGALTQLQNLLIPPGQKGLAVLNDTTVSLLLAVIKKDRSWTRAAAIRFLGLTQDPNYAVIYTNALRDTSDRVVSAAAIALGKSKSPKAFDALAKLPQRPSWKNQSLMSSLNGLKELGDLRGVDIAYKALADLQLPRWRLPNFSVWDFRVFAVETIAALGKSEKAYPLLHDRFNKAMAENDIEGIFNNVLLIALLKDARGMEIFEPLKTKFKDDANAMVAVEQYENQLKEGLKNTVK